MSGEETLSKAKVEGSKRKPRFFDPPNILKKKVGKGGIDMKILEQAETFIDTNEISLDDIAAKIIVRLEEAVARAKASPRADRNHVNAVISPIMELKASGAMFGYGLVSEVAAVMLNFLENLDELNEDALEIIGVHHRTLDVILKNKLKGAGGREGRALADELYDACNRYRKKYLVLVDVDEQRDV